MAVTVNCVLNHIIIDDNINSNIFFDFIKSVIKDLKEKEYIFVFDNVAFHKNKQMLDFIKNAEHKIIFTSPIVLIIIQSKIFLV